MSWLKGKGESLATRWSLLFLDTPSFTLKGGQKNVQEANGFPEETQFLMLRFEVGELVEMDCDGLTKFC